MDVVTCEGAAGCRDRYVARRGQSWHQLSVCLKTVYLGWFAVLASSQCHYLRGQHLLHKCLRSKRPGYCEHSVSEGKCPRRGRLTRFSESPLVNWGTCWTQLTTSEFSHEWSANFPHLPVFQQSKLCSLTYSEIYRDVFTPQGNGWELPTVWLLGTELRSCSSVLLTMQSFLQSQAHFSFESSLHTHSS